MPNSHKMEQFVFSLLKQKIPAYYTYHNYLHTAYVMEKVLEIGKEEHCEDAELALLKTAALWHDTGYIYGYYEHEKAGCALVNFYLPDYGYSPSELALICGMIMATKIPQQPKTKLESILADADLEYLGTDAAEQTSTLLLNELGKVLQPFTKEEWNKKQIDFLQNHQYFTSYCKRVKEPNKNIYLKNLLEQNRL